MAEQVTKKQVEDMIAEALERNKRRTFDSRPAYDSVLDTYSPITGASMQIGFFGTPKTSKPTVSGSRGGNAALQSLLTALASLGLITDNSS